MGVFKKGKNWYIDYYVDGKRKREKVGPSKKLAEIVLKKRKIEIAENKFLDIKKTPKIKFEELAQNYLNFHSRPNKRSYERDELSVKHLSRFFGGKYLHEITPLDVEKYKHKRLEEGVSGATVNRELACLKHMFNKAIEWKMAEDNPVRKVKLFKENQRLRYLSEEEIEKLIDACPSFLKPIVIIALNTGMRKGEILNLKWQDIDFSNRIIHIVRSKSGERREIPMNKTVFETLIALEKHPASDYVFHKANGKPYRDIRGSFKKACKKAGIEDFRFHDLRHTFASHLVMKGVSLKVVQELLGHKTYEMTLRYAHLSPSYKRDAIERINFGIDTIWTPEKSLGIIKEIEEFDKLLKEEDFKELAGVVELGDAPDSKSGGL